MHTDGVRGGIKEYGSKNYLFRREALGYSFWWSRYRRREGIRS